MVVTPKGPRAFTRRKPYTPKPKPKEKQYVLYDERGDPSFIVERSFFLVEE